MGKSNSDLCALGWELWNATSLNGLTLNVGYWARFSPSVLLKSCHASWVCRFSHLAAVMSPLANLHHLLASHSLRLRSWPCFLFTEKMSHQKWSVHLAVWWWISVSLSEHLCSVWPPVPAWTGPSEAPCYARALLETLLPLRQENRWLRSRHLSSSWLLLSLVSQ